MSWLPTRRLLGPLSSSLGRWPGLRSHLLPDEARNIAAGIIEGGTHAEMVRGRNDGGGQMWHGTAPGGGEFVHLTNILLALVLTDRKQETRRGDMGLQQDGTEPRDVRFAQAELLVDEAQANGLEIIQAAEARDPFDAPTQQI